MKILVTGGAGFIGSNFVKLLIQSKEFRVEKIIVLDKLTYAGNLANLAESMNDSRVDFVKGDINDSKLIANLYKKVDAVVHFAAESHVDRSIKSSTEFLVTNILGTGNLLENLRSFPHIKFLHVSTDEVYGSINQGSWDENEPLRPNSPYAASKASSDLIALSYFRTYNLDIMISRCCNNYGPYQYPEKVIPLFITNLLNNMEIPVYGNGENVREWIHVTDHCNALLAILKNGKRGSVYNIGSSFEVSNIELANIILRLMNRESNAIKFVNDRAGHDYRYSLNFTKIRKELDYHPKVDFEAGLLETINWYTANEIWWNSLKF